jgi:hypothetical protein
MRLLRSEEVELVGQPHGRSADELPRHGAIVGLTRLQALARRWYGDRLDPAWRPRTLEASQRILEDAGLTGPFWRLA